MCAKCKAKWGGLGIAHCATCCETFSCVGNFDLHRSRGRCKSPKNCGMVQNSRGIWKISDERDLTQKHYTTDG